MADINNPHSQDAPATPSEPIAEPHATLNGDGDGFTHDVEMKEEPTVEPSLSTLPRAPFETPIPLPGTTPAAPATPNVAAQNTTPTATPTHARGSPHPAPALSVPPANPHPHGSPTRVYLNQNVTPHLLEAMKLLVTHEPEKPLKYLAEFLAEKSRELEGA